MSGALPPAARRIDELLASRGLAGRVVEMPDSTRSAADAARACGCTVGQIAKSIVLRTRRSDRAIVVVASGANRVDETRIAAVIGEPVALADADFVRARTGFAIGGVAPVGFSEPLPIFIDADLLQHDEIWAAAGTPRTVFRLSPAELVQLTGGIVTAVA
ncbi:MAG TPA: YbaK/EbsC family protein [Alphaproteobacteria bacterium]